MMRWCSWARALPVLLAAACSSAPGTPVTLELLAEEAAGADVVFLGEEHDNDAGHAQQLQILKLLHTHRAELVLTMEMFERDVQGVLDKYLAGTIDEAEFLANGRPWPNYVTHYRPLVEYAKKHGLRVVAANVPRKVANMVTKDGVEAVAGNEFAARDTTAPRDAYWESFQQAMEGHGGVDESTMYRFYQAQCLKDDTMAEAIVDVLSATPRPLVVHVNGKFHSDDGLGTAARVVRRMPAVRIAVVTMMAEPNAFRTAPSRYTLVVPEQPEISEVKPVDDGNAAKPTDAPPPEPVDQGDGRPALGFMPGYEDDVLGVLVQALVAGGPAEKAGLHEGDVIVKVGEVDVDSVGDYMVVLQDLMIGQKVQVEVMRGDERKTFEITVGRRAQ